MGFLTAVEEIHRPEEFGIFCNADIPDLTDQLIIKKKSLAESGYRGNIELQDSAYSQQELLYRSFKDAQPLQQQTIWSFLELRAQELQSAQFLWWKCTLLCIFFTSLAKFLPLMCIKLRMGSNCRRVG